eukprot:5871262-Pleurochrysis_carterae.AAC.1
MSGIHRTQHRLCKRQRRRGGAGGANQGGSGGATCSHGRIGQRGEIGSANERKSGGYGAARPAASCKAYITSSWRSIHGRPRRGPSPGRRRGHAPGRERAAYDQGRGGGDAYASAISG